MTAIFALIDNTEKMRKYLFWYLMIIPALLLLWIVLGAANSQMDFQAALKIPFLPGAILSFFLFRSLRFGNLESELAPKYRWVLLPALVFYVLVTVVLFAVNIAMWSK